MTKELKAEILKKRKQKVFCDKCGKELYQTYTKGIPLFCWGCFQKARENYISENQMVFSFIDKKL